MGADAQGQGCRSRDAGWTEGEGQEGMLPDGVDTAPPLPLPPALLVLFQTQCCAPSSGNLVRLHSTDVLSAATREHL